MVKNNIYQGKDYIRPGSQAQQKINKIKIDVRQAKRCAGDQASERGAEGEEGEWALAGVSGSPE